MPVAATRCFAAKYNANQPHAAPFDGSHQIESRCVDIAGFYAISAAVIGKKPVVVFEPAAFPAKAFGTEKFIELWKVTAYRDRQTRHITRR